MERVFKRMRRVLRDEKLPRIERARLFNTLDEQNLEGALCEVPEIRSRLGQIPLKYGELTRRAALREAVNFVDSGAPRLRYEEDIAPSKMTDIL